MALPAKQEAFTFADLLAWEGAEHYELIHGEPFLMAPPSPRHQTVSMEITRQLANFLEGKRCKVYAAPFGVRLFEQDGETPEDVNTMVEPDITVVCDASRLDKHGYKGPPALIIEILSPSSRRHDRLVKLDLYQRAGVPEYWIVDPDNESVQVFLPDNGALRLREDYGREDIARVSALEGCFIELCKVFAE